MKRSQRVVFKVDITQIEGDGDFPCPKCGVTISPNDEADTVYRIVDTKVRKQDLEELVILCTKCESKIHLVGFLQFTQACSRMAPEPVLFWICARKIHEKPRTPRMREINQKERDK